MRHELAIASRLVLPSFLPRSFLPNRRQPISLPRPAYDPILFFGRFGTILRGYSRECRQHLHLIPPPLPPPNHQRHAECESAISRLRSQRPSPLALNTDQIRPFLCGEKTADHSARLASSMHDITYLCRALHRTIMAPVILCRRRNICLLSSQCRFKPAVFGSTGGNAKTRRNRRGRTPMCVCAVCDRMTTSRIPLQLQLQLQLLKKKKKKNFRASGNGLNGDGPSRSATLLKKNLWRRGRVNEFDRRNVVFFGCGLELPTHTAIKARCVQELVTST